MAQKEAAPGHCSIRPCSQAWHRNSPVLKGRAELCAARMAGAVFAPGGSGFSHPGNPQRGCQAGVAGRMHDGGGAVTRVWGLWRPPSYLNRCSQAVDSHGVPGGGGRSQKSLFLCEWPDQMATYPTAWGYSSTKSPKKGVEVEALMKSGALGLPTLPQLQPWEALLDQSTEPSGLQSSLRHENLGPAAQTMHKTTAVCTAFQGVHGPLESHY